MDKYRDIVQYQENRSWIDDQKKHKRQFAIVSDLQKSKAFYQNILGQEECCQVFQPGIQT